MTHQEERARVGLMKTLLQRLWSKLLKHPATGSAEADPAMELYEYPNDENASMEEAVGAIWRW